MCACSYSCVHIFYVCTPVLSSWANRAGDFGAHLSHLHYHLLWLPPGTERRMLSLSLLHVTLVKPLSCSKSPFLHLSTVFFLFQHARIHYTGTSKSMHVNTHMVTTQIEYLISFEPTVLRNFFKCFKHSDSSLLKRTAPVSLCTSKPDSRKSSLEVNDQISHSSLGSHKGFMQTCCSSIFYQTQLKCT